MAVKLKHTVTVQQKYVFRNPHGGGTIPHNNPIIQLISKRKWTNSPSEPLGKRFKEIDLGIGGKFRYFENIAECKKLIVKIEKNGTRTLFYWQKE
ncbi:MAG: hypothetical protein V1847_00380 [Candidatus Diapherotrites archaeon]